MPASKRTPTRAPKLARGQGSCFVDPDKTRRDRYVLEHRWRGKVYRERGSSWPEVERMRDERRAEIERQGGDGSDTVDVLLERWLAYDCKGAPGTMRGYRNTATTVKRSDLGKMSIADVRVAHLETLYGELIRPDRRPRPHGRASLVKLRSHLGMAFDFAVRRGDLVGNVVRSSELPAAAAKPREASVLDRDGFGAMRALLAAERSTLSTALLVGLLTGARPGEVLGLRWDAVDLERRTIRIRTALQAQETSGQRWAVVDELKVRTARRTLPLPADLVAALRHERAEQATRRMAARSWTEPELVFTSDEGRHIRPEQLQKAARSACDALDVDAVRPNELRHSFASMMIELGFKLPAVARALGHVNTKMLATTYGHALDDVVPTAAALDALVEGTA